MCDCEELELYMDNSNESLMKMADDGIAAAKKPPKSGSIKDWGSKAKFWPKKSNIAEIFNENQQALTNTSSALSNLNSVGTSFSGMLTAVANRPDIFNNETNFSGFMSSFDTGITNMGSALTNLNGMINNLGPVNNMLSIQEIGTEMGGSVTDLLGQACQMPSTMGSILQPLGNILSILETTNPSIMNDISSIANKVSSTLLSPINSIINTTAGYAKTIVDSGVNLTGGLLTPTLSLTSGMNGIVNGVSGLLGGCSQLLNSGAASHIDLMSNCCNGSLSCLDTLQEILTCGLGSLGSTTIKNGESVSSVFSVMDGLGLNVQTSINDTINPLLTQASSDFIKSVSEQPQVLATLNKEIATSTKDTIDVWGSKSKFFPPAKPKIGNTIISKELPDWVTLSGDAPKDLPDEVILSGGKKIPKHIDSWGSTSRYFG